MKKAKKKNIKKTKDKSKQKTWRNIENKKILKWLTENCFNVNGGRHKLLQQ